MLVSDKNFNNIKIHTQYSICEGAVKIDELAEYCKTNKIKSIINEGDRCLILSENRPYWLMTDIAIMNAGGISVPIFTTYSSIDYEYILKDCDPSIIIVSNNEQFKKIKNYICGSRCSYFRISKRNRPYQRI